ncbi:MAG TPA: hypothetical protein VGH89_03385 [Pseudonocardia sp.]|jgi:hypothetical protein
MHKIGQRVTMGLAAVALGSAGLAGSALACGHHASAYTHGDGGNGGGGGKANANCAVPIGISAGVLGQGGPIQQCNATGGAGGGGGTGASY